MIYNIIHYKIKQNSFINENFSDTLEGNYGDRLLNFIKTNICYCTLFGVVARELAITNLKASNKLVLYRLSIQSQLSWKSKYIIEKEKLSKRLAIDRKPFQPFDKKKFVSKSKFSFNK